MRIVRERTKLLTARQIECLVTIESFTREHHYPPTIRDLCEILNISSTNGVRNKLNALESKGRITREKMTARGIRVLDAVTEEEKSFYEAHPW